NESGKRPCYRHAITKFLPALLSDIPSRILSTCLVRILSPAASLKDCLGNIPDGFDGFAAVHQANDPAGAGLQPFIAPGERTDQATLIQHELDIATDVFCVNQSLLEGQAVERKD